MLNSYWLVVHVAAAITATGVLMLSGVVASVHLGRRRYERLVTAGRAPGFSAVTKMLPDARTLDRAEYRLIAFGFPIWTFAVIAGAIWAEAAWGHYWQWDPKETWALITWIVYAAYLHARATPGLRKWAAHIAVLAFATMIFNYYVINIYIVGKHSYAGIKVATYCSALCTSALLVAGSVDGRIGVGIDSDLTDQVLASWAGTSDPRLLEILESLTHHLHAFVREVAPTQQEWEHGHRLPDPTGQIVHRRPARSSSCSPTSSACRCWWTDPNHRPPGAHQLHRAGPFHLVDSPPGIWATTSRSTVTRSPAWWHGRVIGSTANPLAGAEIDVWQTNEDGFYDVQQPDLQPAGEPARSVPADEEGRFWFRSRSCPRFYPIPDRRSRRCPAARPPAVTRTARRTCTSSSPRRATAR